MVNQRETEIQKKMNGKNLPFFWYNFLPDEFWQNYKKWVLGIRVQMDVGKIAWSNMLYMNKLPIHKDV